MKNLPGFGTAEPSWLCFSFSACFLMTGEGGSGGCSPSPSDVAEMPASLLNLLPRFFKLHERKCEPIIMTVPRKVSPVLLGLCDLTELPEAGQLTGLTPVFCFCFFLTPPFPV